MNTLNTQNLNVHYMFLLSWLKSSLFWNVIVSFICLSNKSETNVSNSQRFLLWLTLAHHECYYRGGGVHRFKNNSIFYFLIAILLLKHVSNPTDSAQIIQALLLRLYIHGKDFTWLSNYQQWHLFRYSHICVRPHKHTHTHNLDNSVCTPLAPMTAIYYLTSTLIWLSYSKTSVDIICGWQSPPS
jgi:hypothetical protein